MLLQDLVCLHYFLWKKEQQPETSLENNGAATTPTDASKEANAEVPSKDGEDTSANTTEEKKPEDSAAVTIATTSKVNPPTEGKDVENLASRLIELFAKGRRYELSGLKDVPTPFFKPEGRFFEKLPAPETEDQQKWIRLDDAGAKAYVSKLILDSFSELAESDNADLEKSENTNADGNAAAIGESESTAISKSVDILFANLKEHKSGEEAPADPRPYDVIFLPVQTPWEENMNYEHSSGNKNLLYLASQHVSVDTKQSISRVKAAFSLITAKVQVTSGTELATKDQRFVILRNTGDKGQNIWENMERNDLAEFAAIFVLEVFLEKRIYDETAIGNSINAETFVTPGSTQAAMKDLLSPSDANKPSDVPIPHPTTHDVLFGRGGMTNGHTGNRRFRDIIALHRPDYVRATKMDKPNVARKIVRAIRQGNPPGRFLRKGADNMWRDVGDKIAAEKTSQGLRERSNAEKRQRSAMRESLRIGQRDSLGGESADGTPGSKKIKLDPAAVAIGMGGALNGNIVPITLSAKKGIGAKKNKKGINGTEEETHTESLPPNAVDKDGNIMVTDHDILCGRGGLTNHHKGNKRFRDIVALHRPDYVRAPKIQKPSVARVIVRAIRNGDPPGRFLKKDASTSKWFDIGDKKAAEKTSQALREKSDEEKEGKVPVGFTSPTLHIVPTAAAAATNVDATLTDAAVQAAVAATQVKLEADTGADAAMVIDAAAVKSEETKGEEAKGDLVLKQEVEGVNETHVEV